VDHKKRPKFSALEKTHIAADIYMLLVVVDARICYLGVKLAVLFSA